jgi:hypothetical protein
LGLFLEPTIPAGLQPYLPIAGGSLSAAMSRPAVRLWLERSIGTIFLVLAAAILIELARRGGAIG